MTEEMLPSELIDRFNRHVTYLRISVTDRCDFRCLYCMSEDMEFVPRSQILTLEETATIARAFTELGVTKIRVTGGEPLVRRNVISLFRDLGSLPGLRELTMTSNCSQMRRWAAELREAGLNRVNVSLDSLQPARFREMTRYGELERVLDGIEAAREAGFDRIKINSVILRGHNEDEIPALVEFAAERGMDISFIEEMPLGPVNGHSRFEAYYSSDEVLRDIQQHFDVLPTTESTGGPSRYYRLVDSDTRIGFISPHSHNFCSSCNRVRLTAEGRLLLCLGQEHSVDLKQVVRDHPGDMHALKRAIVQSMDIKPKGHDFSLQGEPVILRHMNVTGG